MLDAVGLLGVEIRGERTRFVEESADVSTLLGVPYEIISTTVTVAWLFIMRRTAVTMCLLCGAIDTMPASRHRTCMSHLLIGESPQVGHQYQQQ